MALAVLTSAPAPPRTHTDAILLLGSASAVRWDEINIVMVMITMVMAMI